MVGYYRLSLRDNTGTQPVQILVRFDKRVCVTTARNWSLMWPCSISQARKALEGNPQPLYNPACVPIPDFQSVMRPVLDLV